MQMYLILNTSPLLILMLCKAVFLGVSVLAGYGPWILGGRGFFSTIFGGRWHGVGLG